MCLFFAASQCVECVVGSSGGGTAEAAINASECCSMPRTELLEEVRRTRQMLATLGNKGKEVQLAEQEADLMLLFAEHIEREEERKREDTFQLERVKVGQNTLIFSASMDNGPFPPTLFDIFNYLDLMIRILQSQKNNGGLLSGKFCKKRGKFLI